MKKLAKISALICAIAMIVSVFAVNAFAVTDENNVTVSIELDKEAYEAGEVATAKVTVTNGNDFEIQNVSITEALAAEGMTVVSIDENIASIPAGASQTFEVKVQKAEEEPTPSTPVDPSEGPGESVGPAPSGDPGPVTGENGMLILYIVLGVLAVGGIAFFAIKSRKKATKVIAVLLCVAMAAPLALGGISASAVEPRQSTYVINGGTDTAKVGDVISIQVDITENPGIITSRFEIGYDDTKLKFVSYSNGSVFQLAQLTEIAGSNADDYANAEEVIRVDNPQNPVTMYFSAGAARRNITKTGTMITLNFEVIAEGSSEVTFNGLNSSGIDEEDPNYGQVIVNFNDVAAATIATESTVEPTDDPAETTPPAETEDPTPTEEPPVTTDLVYEINDVYDASIGDVVEIAVDLTNNPGILTSKFTVAYDATRLKFVGYIMSDEVFGKEDLVEIYGSNLDEIESGADIITVQDPKNPITVFFNGGAASQNFTNTGRLITLRFEVIANGEANVTLTPIDAFNFDGENVSGNEVQAVVSTDVASENIVVPEPPEMPNPFTIEESIDVTYDQAYTLTVTVSYELVYPAYYGVGYGRDEYGKYISLYVFNNPGVITTNCQLVTEGITLTGYRSLGVLNGLTELKGSNEGDLASDAELVRLDTYDGSVVIRFIDGLAQENNTATGAVIKLYFEEAEGDNTFEVIAANGFDKDGNEVAFEGTSGTIAEY